MVPYFPSLPFWNLWLHYCAGGNLSDDNDESMEGGNEVNDDQKSLNQPTR